MMTFEERLLTELKAEVATRSSDPLPAPSPARHRRWMWGTAAGLTVVGTATAVAITEAPGRTQTPVVVAAAYAIDRSSDGSVLVRIRELKDPGRLQADLKKAGITALVQYMPPGMMCHVVIGSQPPGVEDLMRRVTSPPRLIDDQQQFRVFPGVLKPGMTLVLTGIGVAGAPANAASSMVLDLTIAGGRVAPCVPQKVAHPPVYYQSHPAVPPTPTPPSN